MATRGDTPALLRWVQNVWRQFGVDSILDEGKQGFGLPFNVYIPISCSSVVQDSQLARRLAEKQTRVAH